MVTSIDNYVRNYHGQRAILTDCRHRDLPETEFMKATVVKEGMISLEMIDGDDVVVPEDRLCFVIRE